MTVFVEFLVFIVGLVGFTMLFCRVCQEGDYTDND